MSILDDIEKINDDMMVTISKKMFKEALEEKSKELVDRVICHVFPLINEAQQHIIEIASKKADKEELEQLSFTMNEVNREVFVRICDLEKKCFPEYFEIKKSNPPTNFS
jgi:hypothetical protein